MPTMDAYKTIDGMATAEYEEKKSRFIGQVAHVETEEEALAFLGGIRTANPMARHNVYAYVLREGNRVRYSDDGEPARTSGLPTLDVIQHAGLVDVICVTTRYFGGTLLGTGGLVRAYTKAAQDALAAATTVQFTLCRDLHLVLPYARYDQVARWLAARDAPGAQDVQAVDTQFGADVDLVLRAPSTRAEAVQAALVELTAGDLLLELGEEAFQPLQVS